MTAITPSAVNMKFKFPEFSSVDDGTIEFAVEEAVVACGTGEWVDDSNRTLALMYYAAHLLKVSMIRADGEVIQSERIGELSLTYAVPNTNPALDFNLTTYGVRYRDLVRKNFPSALTVGSAVRM